MKITGVLLAALLLGGCATQESSNDTTEAAEDARPTIDCADIADQAVTISADDQSGDPKLLKVRSPDVVKDRRNSYTIPTGDKDETVLVCEGLGVWSDGSDDRVRIRLSVDSDKDAWVYFEPVY